MRCVAKRRIHSAGPGKRANAVHTKPSTTLVEGLHLAPLTHECETESSVVADLLDSSPTERPAHPPFQHYCVVGCPTFPASILSISSRRRRIVAAHARR